MVNRTMEQYFKLVPKSKTLNQEYSEIHLIKNIESTIH